MKKSLMLTDFALACAFGVLAVFSAFLPFCADAPRWWRVVARMVTLAITALLYTRQYGERRLFPLRFLCVAVCLFWTGIFILTFMRPGSVLDGIWYMQYIQKSVVHLWGLAASLYLLVISLRLRREGGRALIPTVAAAAAGAGFCLLLILTWTARNDSYLTYLGLPFLALAAGFWRLAQSDLRQG
mgnify:FL=1